MGLGPLLAPAFSDVSLPRPQSCEPELKVLLYDEDGELLYRPLVDSGLADLE